jgi:hypothetical protein
MSISTLNAEFTYAPAFYLRAQSQEEARAIEVASGLEARGTDIAVRSSPAFSVSGVIVAPADGNKPVRYAVGFARGGGTATISLPNPSFTLRGLAPGRYTLVGEANEEGKAPRRGFVDVTILDSDVRVAIEVGRTAILSGRLDFKGANETLPSDLRVRMVPDTPDAVAGSASVLEDGRFTIEDLPAGTYRLALGGHEERMYLRGASCAGRDYLVSPISLEPGQKTTDCSLTIGFDVGEVSGEVANEDKPAEGLVVILIPKEPSRRRVARHNVTSQSDANGRFLLLGVIPGEYFAFAVPAYEDRVYYDLEFPERNRNIATSLTVKSGEKMSLTLKQTKAR